MAYKVKFGDTLSQIAKDNNTTVEELARINGIQNPNLIHVGDEIKLPGESSQGSQTNAQSGPGNTLMKSPVKGVSDELYTKANTPYQKSDNIKAAQDYIQKSKEALEGGTKWDPLLDEIINERLNREEFSYDFENDPLFQNMLSQYQQQGNMAMRDMVAQASALTGGYANSWAQTAGQQVYNNYLQEAYNNLPAYYQLALDRYNLEGAELDRRYALLSAEDQKEYDRLVNQYNIAGQEYDRLFNEEHGLWSEENQNNWNLINLLNSEAWNQEQWNAQQQRAYSGGGSANADEGNEGYDMYDLYLEGVQAAAKRGDQDLLQYLNSLPLDTAQKKALLFEAELSPDFVEENTTDGLYNGLDPLKVQQDVNSFLKNIEGHNKEQKELAKKNFLRNYEGTTMYDYVDSLLNGSGDSIWDKIFGFFTK